VFLGFYVPHDMLVPLWDLDSDYYLHNKVRYPDTVPCTPRAPLCRTLVRSPDQPLPQPHRTQMHDKVETRCATWSLPGSPRQPSL